MFCVCNNCIPKNVLMNIRFLLTAIAILFMQACQKDADNISIQDSKPNLTANYDSKIIDIWTNVYLTIERDLREFKPTASSRALAYIYMAAYETGRPGMPDFISNQHHLPSLKIPNLASAITDINWEAALNTCFATTLRHFLIKATPQHLELIDETERNMSIEFRDQMFGDVQQNSINWGQNVANAIINYADTDSAGLHQSTDAYPNSYNIPVGMGKWRPITPVGRALFPFWGQVRTFAAQKNDLLSPPPYTFSSQANSIYYQQQTELYQRSNGLSFDEKWQAEFWSDEIDGLTYSSSGRLFSMALQMISNENLHLDESLHLLCKLGIAVNDGAVAAWQSKYYYNTERPQTFIEQYIDPSFKSNLGSAIGTQGLMPPCPSYPSIHTTYGGIFQQIFTEFFGANYSFTDKSHLGRTEFLGEPRTYTSWQQMAEECANSRLLMGVNIKMDCDEGLRLGTAIGRKVLSYKLKF